eukprot:scaffold2215_cov353-Prasinococcus_capsulatus_cf.AAC.1
MLPRAARGACATVACGRRLRRPRGVRLAGGSATQDTTRDASGHRRVRNPSNPAQAKAFITQPIVVPSRPVPFRPVPPGGRRRGTSSPPTGLGGSARVRGRPERESSNRSGPM